MTAVTAAIFIGTLIVLTEVDRSSGGIPSGLCGGRADHQPPDPRRRRRARLARRVAAAGAVRDLLPAARGGDRLAALFATGLFCDQGRLPLVARLTGLKLFVMPGIAFLLAGPTLQMPPVEAAIAVILAAMPTGSLVFIISHRYGIEEDVVAATTLATSVGSAVTIAALLVVFGVG